MRESGQNCVYIQLSRDLVQKSVWPSPRRRGWHDQARTTVHCRRSRRRWIKARVEMRRGQPCCRVPTLEGPVERGHRGALVLASVSWCCPTPPNRPPTGTAAGVHARIGWAPSSSSLEACMAALAGLTEGIFSHQKAHHQVRRCHHAQPGSHLTGERGTRHSRRG